MFISGRTAIAALRHQLTETHAGGVSDPISLQAAQILLDLLDRHEADRDGTLMIRAAAAAELWDIIADCLQRVWSANDADAACELRRRLTQATDAVELSVLEYEGEALLSAILADRGVASGDIACLAQRIAPAEAALPAILVPGDRSPGLPASAALDAATLTGHLRRITGDPNLRVLVLDYLPGGFGKQTYMFSASGSALNGEFVLRVDHNSGPLFAKDCHLIGNEFEVISQLHDQGFPTPRPILVGLGGDRLRGCDMMVVARSTGDAGGQHLPDGRAADHLIAQLAALAAGLHALDPPPSLDASGTTASRELLSLSREQCTRLNILGWRDYWRNTAHSPSCALVALYELLLRIVPTDYQPPRLVHGDFGVHNCMVENGEVVAVIDWESAHLGDPAEDIAFTIRAFGLVDDPGRYLQAYYAAGGVRIEDITLAFYDLMAQVRSICICNLSGARFAAGAPEALKLVTAGASFAPYFLGSIGDTVRALMPMLAVD